MILRFFYKFFLQTPSFNCKCTIINPIKHVFSKLLFLGRIGWFFLLKMQKKQILATESAIK